MPLTDAQVRQAKLGAKPYTLGDSGGLALFVTPRGAKHWHFRFSWKRKQLHISFGSYPLVSLRQARSLSDEARVQIAQGIDPRSDRAARRRNGKDDDGTFAALAERWFAFKSPRWTDAPKGTAWKVRQYLDKDILPRLGHLPLAEIGRSDVLAVQHQIEARGALNIAKKVRGWLNEMFRFAVAERKMEFNPAADLVEPFLHPARNTHASPAQGQSATPIRHLCTACSRRKDQAPRAASAGQPPFSVCGRARRDTNLKMVRGRWHRHRVSI